MLTPPRSRCVSCSGQMLPDRPPDAQTVVKIVDHIPTTAMTCADCSSLWTLDGNRKGGDVAIEVAKMLNF